MKISSKQPSHLLKSHPHPRNNPPLPIRRSKEPPRSTGIRIHTLNRRIQIIRIVIRSTNPPPTRHLRVRQIQRQDDHDRADGQTDVQARTRDVVEAHPPPAVAVADVPIEDVPDDAPREVVERGGGRDLARAAEDEREGDVLDGCAGEHAREEVDADWGEDADEPEPL